MVFQLFCSIAKGCRINFFDYRKTIIVKVIDVLPVTVMSLAHMVVRVTKQRVSVTVEAVSQGVAATHATASLLR